MSDPGPGRPKNASLILACFGVLSACMGAVGDQTELGGNPSQAGGGPAGTERGARPPAIPSPDTGLRRLTRTELNNTLRDLLGDRAAGNALPVDATFNGLDNNADLLNGTALVLERYDVIANDVVEKALANRATRARLVTCDLAAAGCPRTVIGAFARRAWRRPLESAELDSLARALDLATAQGDGAEEGVKLAFRMLLVSPNFLYRIEQDPAGGRPPHPITPHELATRLSYFLWSSTPDDELLAAAEAAGDANLASPKTLATQLERMLRDVRADALVDNFAAQWLDTRKLAYVAPDLKTFPTWNDALRPAMASEAQLLFRAVWKGDLVIPDLLETDFTFANDRLAKHYGMPPVTGAEMQKVSVSGGRRFGLLSQASFLTGTSNPSRTNVPRRGKWVLSRMLCVPPGEPPANVPPLESVNLPANATVRDRLAMHKTKGAACAGCHSSFDPIGLALEHYDGIGVWRDSYRGGVAIDATGTLPDGFTFDGALPLSRHLKSDPRFVQCVTRTVFAYALGRDPTADGDRAALDVLAEDLAVRGNRIGDLVRLIAASDAFLLRGGQP